MKTITAGLLVLCAVATAGCEDPTPQPGAAELALVTRKIDAEINAPITMARKKFADAASDGKINNWELSIAGDGQKTSVDWWAAKQGFMKAGGVSQGYPYFSETPQGEAFAKSTAPWLISSFQSPPTVSCAGSASRASCSVAGVALIKPTAEAGKALEGKVLKPQPFLATLEYGPPGWRVGEVTLTSAERSYALGLNTLIGDPQTVRAEWAKFEAEANKAFRAYQ